jgi:hypothetical protein
VLGSGLLLILLPVDVVLGPLLTLIVFKSRKKSLKFDLSVIALLQLSALFYGMYVVFIARPAYIVFAVDRYEVVSANEIEPAELKKVTREEFKALPLAGPRLVAAQIPSDPKEKERILFSALAGADIQVFPQHYVPYADQIAEVSVKARPIDELRKKLSEAEKEFVNLDKRFGARLSELGYLPVHTRKQDFTAIVDRKNGEIVKYLMVDPWL